MLGAGSIVGGRYELAVKLGQGGMGAVWRARHLVSGHEVALKLIVMPGGLDADVVRRFQREARASASIRHEGVVEVLDAGLDLDEGVLFLAMELLVGESLRARFAHATTTREEKLDLLVALLDPLAAAHARGFVHRDLKPDNVFVARTPDGSERVKLLDFGIARQLGQEGVTLTGAGIGTPQYMAPEQAVSAKEATAAADVWSVGVMLYEAVAGAPPFDGPTPHAVILAVCTRPHRAVPDGTPPRLAALIDACLTKTPEDRPEDARALRELLREALDLPPAPPDPTMPPPRTAPPGLVDFDTPTLPLEPRPTPPGSEPALPTREVRGVGFRLALPVAWEERPTSLPAVIATYVDASSSLEPPPTLRLKRERFGGDTRGYADLGLDNLAAVGTVHRTADASVGGHPGIEVEATYRTGEPPLRLLMRCVVVDGEGWVASVSAAASDFARVRSTGRRILDSIVIDAPGAHSASTGTL